MSSRRTRLALVVAGRYIYAIGGMVDGAISATVERYDGEPMPRSSPAATAMDGDVFVVGGTAVANICSTKGVERFDGHDWIKVRR